MKINKINMNPKNLKVGDCVIRALCLTDEKKDWRKIYSELCEIGLKMCRMPNDPKVFSKWLDNNGWVKMKMPKKPTGKRYKLYEYIDENPELQFVANLAKHLTFVDKGTLIDTWDCSEKCLGNYWIKI